MSSAILYFLIIWTVPKTKTKSSSQKKFNLNHDFPQKKKKNPRNSVVTAPSLIVIGNRCGEIESRPTSCFLYVKNVIVLGNWSCVNLMAYMWEVQLSNTNYCSA